MNLNRTRLFLITSVVPVSILFFSTLKASYLLSAQTPKEDCPISFQKFAYDGPRDRSEALFLPTHPWQVEIANPIKQHDSTPISLDRVVTTHLFNGQQEIWLSGWKRKPDGANLDWVTLIYQPQSQHWEIISLDILDTDLKVYGIFTTKDGNIWARVARNIIDPKRKTVPVLARFNEVSRRFELAEGVMEIPIEYITASDYIPVISIIGDRDSSLWIFIEKDGLYRYDPKNKVTEKRVDFDFRVDYKAISTDGSIYYKNSSIYESGFRLGKNSLLRFTPENNQVVVVDTPDEEWPNFSGMLFDHNNRLWLGAIGYQETDGSWHRIVPNPEEIIRETWVKGYTYAPPTLVLESSDGLLWYSKGYEESRWKEGLAWYDPKTGEGCMISNRPAQPIEDQQHVLWMVIDGILYKRPTQP